jgi:hypothetical protein
MDVTFLINLLGGIGSLVLGIIILFKTISDSRRGYNGFLGSHIKLYVSSIAFILLGIALIYSWLF